MDPSHSQDLDSQEHHFEAPAEAMAAIGSNKFPKVSKCPTPPREKAKVCLPERLWQPHLPYYHRLRQSMMWWERHAPLQVLNLIRDGVCPTFPNVSLPIVFCHRDHNQLKAAQDLIQEYLQLGAIEMVDLPGTRYLIPWFVLSKPEGDHQKHRLIADCRVLNKFLCPVHFHLDHWKDIFPFLRKGMWATKVDLKNAYFHLANSQSLRPYMRINVGPQVYQFNSACFGLNVLPQLWTCIMKVFQKRWREKGLLVFVYLDDILVIGSSPTTTARALSQVLQDLVDSGMVVNEKKCVFEPTQQIQHLGFHLDLATGFLKVPVEKLRSVRRELGKLVVLRDMSSRKMAAILGVVRSFLTAMPFLRAFTGEMMLFVQKHKISGWDKRHAVPLGLQQQVREVKDLMETWEGRTLGGLTPVRELHSDSSDFGWGGVDLTTGAAIQEFWREQSGLHINVKELQAAIHTIKSLAHRGETVHLCVDNSVAFSYLRKGGGRLEPFNVLMQELWKWCMVHDIKVVTSLVPSAEDQADELSRFPQDHGDYALNDALLHRILPGLFPWVRPDWDMFASPGNHKFLKFVCRWPHWQAQKLDALSCSLGDVHHCFANPPWTLIGQWLNRLRDNPHIVCLMVTPYWVSALWWPLLIRLKVGGSKAFLLPPFREMFRDCWGVDCPPTRWPLLCCVLSGKSYKEGKFHLKVSPLT